VKVTKIMRKPSASMIAALIALFVALGGTAAASGGLITGSQIKNHSIGLIDLSKATVKRLHGSKRAQGTKGDTGPQGPQGQQGSQGPQGEAGAQGPKGDSGQLGPKGDQGPRATAGSQVLPARSSLRERD
jgi:Collagen triple helix repeat (20 copies)